MTAAAPRSLHVAETSAEEESDKRELTGTWTEEEASGGVPLRNGVLQLNLSDLRSSNVVIKGRYAIRAEEQYAVDTGNLTAPSAGISLTIRNPHSSSIREAENELETADLPPSTLLPNGGAHESRVSFQHTSCLADDLLTGHRVFLKFYPQHSPDFQREKEMHELLDDSKSACKLVDVLPSLNEISSCLVFEAGSCTLAHRVEERTLSPTEQQETLHSVLQNLYDLHNRGVVHGNLDPSHIMWFARDNCWKFVNFQAASAVGEQIPLDSITSRRYAAPEIQKALELDARPIPTDASSDMFSFGLIAFEVFTRSSVIDADRVKQYIARERHSLENGQHEDHAVANAGSVGVTAKTIERQLLELNFVMDLLHEHPTERKTAAQALEAIRFCTASENEDPARTLFEYFNCRHPLDESVYRLGKWPLCHIAFNHIDMSVAVERFDQSDDAEVAFYKRGIKKTKKFYDDYLPKHPVYVLRANETFRIRISMGRDCQLRFPLQEIVSVNVNPPDGGGRSVEVWQSSGGDILDALALVEPSEFTSTRLNGRCPIFGLVDTKYVRLTVHVTLRLGDGFPYDIDVYPPVYLQLKRPARQYPFLKRLKTRKQTAVRGSDASADNRREVRSDNGHDAAVSIKS